MSEDQDRNYVVAIGASAGGLKAIKELIAELPGDFDAPVVIASHSSERSRLYEALAPLKNINLRRAEDGDQLEKSTVYILPGGSHGFFRDGAISISSVEKTQGFRPSIDGLFMTLASEYGEDAIAVVLSGTLKDGMRGAQVIHDMGGITIVQDPDEAEWEEMPNSVIYNDHPRKVLSAKELGIWLKERVGAV